MKKKLLIILSCLLALTLSACSVNINTGDGQSAGTSAPDASGSAAPTETEEVVEQDAFTNAQGAVIAPNAKGIRVSRALRIYEEAAQRIKTEAIGFSRTHWQDFNDINAIDSTGIADFVLTIVSKNTVPNNSAQEAAQNPETFASGDAASIRENFPLFGFDSVYVESENNDYIAGAEYIETDNYREYYIYFRDALNPKTGTAGFGGLMTPFDREEVLDGIRNYGILVDESSLKLDCTYSGCYMMFRIDNDDNLIYLEQNLYATIDAKAEIDLVVQSTNFMNGTCRYEEHYTYSQFTY